MKAALAKACTTIEVNAEYCRINFIFKPDFVGFAGHFPNHPILPAIVQIMLAEYAIKQTGLEFKLGKVKKAKFLLPILPDIVCVLEVSQKNQAWNCAIETEQGRAAHFSLEGANG